MSRFAELPEQHVLKELLDYDPDTGHLWWREDYGKWVARLYIDGKEKHLGSFSKKEDAIFALNEAREKNGYHRNHGK